MFANTGGSGEPACCPWKRQQAVGTWMTITGTSCLSACICTRLPRAGSKFVMEKAGEAPGRRERPPSPPCGGRAGASDHGVDVVSASAPPPPLTHGSSRLTWETQV